jgi:hypothetical protein
VDIFERHEQGAPVLKTNNFADRVRFYPYQRTDGGTGQFCLKEWSDRFDEFSGDATKRYFGET